MTKTDHNRFMNTAHALADAARVAILPHFRAATLAAENKEAGGFDPVTVADRASEAVMRDILADLAPEDGIIGEEFGVHTGTSGLNWVLDPIDGTRGFISGTPTWGVLIALCDADGPILGMIDQPYIGERFWGGFGRAEMRGPQGARDLSVLGSRALNDAILFTTFPEVGTADDRAGFEAVSKLVKLTRFGMDCYAYALLASGQIDLVIEAGLNNYDIAAPIGLIQGAGGIVTDWQGGPAHNGGRVVAAAGPEQHRAALEILHKIPLA